MNEEFLVALREENKKTPPMVARTVRIPEELEAKLVKTCDRNQITFASLVRGLIEKGFEEASKD